MEGSRMYHLTIYTRPMCSDCAKTKEKLQQAGVHYVEHDLSENEEKENELKKLTGSRVVPGLVFKPSGLIGKFKKPVVYTGYERNQKDADDLILQMQEGK
ncbi:hypothetical protein DH09_14985 [Bacillaceae bacterium JMAK1]|nr:hypothetical protein DH09_14985 [Bacillaceae bacterium JMAK1]